MLSPRILESTEIKPPGPGRPEARPGGSGRIDRPPPARPSGGSEPDQHHLGPRSEAKRGTPGPHPAAREDLHPAIGIQAVGELPVDPPGHERPRPELPAVGVPRELQANAGTFR